MIFEILTLFPGMFQGPFTESILKRASDRELLSIRLTNIRDYSEDTRHFRVDDYPYGGDPGMVMKPEPLAAAIRAVRERHESRFPVIFLTPHGEPLTHRVVESLSCEPGLILLCGHYKGVDERIRQTYVDREISLGDFVLSGGEIPAMALVDAVSRLLPGVLGNEESAGRDSHFNGLLGAPCYTRPETFEGLKVPEILLSGHHARIEEWQRQESERLTCERRPDLWRQYLEEQKSK